MKLADLIIFIFASATALISCSDGNFARFNIINETNLSLDSVCITPDYRCVYFSVDKAGRTNRKIDMGGIIGDGEFVLGYKSGSKKISVPFEYFSNGSQLAKLTKITIYPDTFLVKREYSIFPF